MSTPFSCADSIDSSPLSPASPHILVFPFPAQGHILPLLDLTHQLALRGLTLTVLVTPKNLPILQPLLSLHPPTSIQTLVFPLPSHPCLPPGAENIKDIGNHANYPMINALHKLCDSIVDWFKACPSPPIAILSDFFLGWTLHLGNKLGIPRISFYSSGAFLACVVDYCWRHLEKARDSSVVEFADLPRSPLFHARELPSLFRRYKDSDPDSELVRDSILANMSSWGCVINTFASLEGEYVECLKKKSGSGQVYQVGPVSLIGANSSGHADMDSDPGTNVLSWLDGCPEGSVLYICFGSQKLLNNQQMEALAAGLEMSETRFIWVVKSDRDQQVKDGYGVVPAGFENRVAGRGFVIKGWAPQVAILNHRAVFGFLSHCGWNSTLEGIAAGVMILAWPMEADQFVDARLLLEDIGMAVMVCEGADSVPDSAKLSKVIADSISEDVPEKARAKKIRDEALAAVKDGGSSMQDLDRLVKDLALLQNKGWEFSK